MKRETYISIPQPCHENWDSMTPKDKGRFCAQCAKTVIDFSGMSDAQILNYLSQTKGRVCGRFAQDQLERPLVPIKNEKKKIWWLAALMPLALLFDKANGQKLIKKVPDIEFNKCERSMGLVATGTHNVTNVVQNNSDKVLTGIVTDKNHIAIPNASILLKGTTIGTAADNSGKFRLSFPAQESFTTIVITAVGYEAREITCTFKNPDEININLQTLLLKPAAMGDVVVVGYAATSHSAKKINTVKTAIRKILRNNPYKVYPNPVNRGETLHMTIKKAGRYSIQLLDVNSKLITTDWFDAAKNETVAALTIPDSTAAGICFIRLINDDTKQQFTDKILVQ